MKSIESQQSNRHLAFTDSFKKLTREHPNIISNILDVISKTTEINTPINIEGVTVTQFEGSSLPVYKIEIGSEEFFLKHNPIPYEKIREKGFEEFHTTLSAKEILIDFPRVEIVEGVLGYRDHNDTYFVSKWNKNLTTGLREYVIRLRVQLFKNPQQATELQEELDELTIRSSAIQSKLAPHGFDDVFMHNMAYDPNSGKIFIFDLNKK